MVAPHAVRETGDHRGSGRQSPVTRRRRRVQRGTGSEVADFAGTASDAPVQPMLDPQQ